MLANPPVLLYNRPHHWMWMVRRLLRLGRFLVLGVIVGFCALLTAIGGDDFELQLPAGILFGALSCAGAIYCGFIFLDWKTRTIHLYSDGRLDYEFGIVNREGKSLSMRFGAVRYVYHSRIATWLDCADLILPFDAGTIDAIRDFRYFWNIAQGRI